MIYGTASLASLKEDTNWKLQMLVTVLLVNHLGFEN